MSKKFMSFIFPETTKKQIDSMPTAEMKLKFYEAVSNYGMYGIEPEGLSDMEYLIWIPMQDLIDSCNTSKGGAPEGNCNAKKQPKQLDLTETTETTENNQNNLENIKTTETTLNNHNDNHNCNDNDNHNISAEPSEKPTLAEREPKNDIEQVEKAYLLNYGSLFKLGILKSEKPIINWGQSRKLTRSAIDSYGLENILLAIERSKDSEFCIKKGYSLSTILSAGVLAGLINGGEQYVKKKSALADFESPPDIMDDVIF